MNTFRCRIVTLDGCQFDKEVTSITVPSIKGVLGILPNRLPIVAALKPNGGILKINTIENNEEVSYFFVVKGGSVSNKRKESIILTDSLKEVSSYEEGLELLN